MREQEYYKSLKPPSSNNSAPSIKAESSDARYNAAAASSSAAATRLTGVKFPIASFIALASSALPVTEANTGVSTGPGVNAFTRIFRSSKSAEKLRASERTAALVAEYAAWL